MLISSILIHQNLVAAMKEREIKGACRIQFEVAAQGTNETTCEDSLTFRQCASWVGDLEQELNNAEYSITFSWFPKQRCKSIALN